MMKMMILAPRRAGMTHAEFRRYVIEVHGPLVKSEPEVAGDIHHYHYNFPIEGATDAAFMHPMADDLDIVTQGWFDSRPAQLRNMARKRYLAVVRPDEHRFADGSRATMHYTHEIEITAGAVTPQKMFYFRRRRADLGREEFQSRWRCGFTEIVAESAVWQQVVSRCIQNHTLPAAVHPHGDAIRYFDVADELFLAAPDTIGHLREDASLMANLADLEAALLDPAHTRAYVTSTVTNIP